MHQNVLRHVTARWRSIFVACNAEAELSLTCTPERRGIYQKLPAAAGILPISPTHEARLAKCES